MAEERHPVVVAGAGIIGTAIAYELVRRGEKVTLIDRREPGHGASYGNMASIAVNGFDAVSRPSTWMKIPGWLIDRKAPVTVDLRYVPKMLPWLIRFLAAGTPSRIREIEDAGASLATRSLDDLKPMLDSLDALSMLSRETCLLICNSEQEFRAARGNMEMMARYGLPFEVIEGEAIRALEPALNPAISKVIVLPRNHFISDPYSLVRKLAVGMQLRGGTLAEGTVAAIERGADGVHGVRLEDGRFLPASKVILALGVDTRILASDLGEPIPLETERGYHTQIMSPGVDLKYSLIWPERAFMITPTAGGIRVGGSVEMAGLGRAPDWQRARKLVEHAKYAVPGLQAKNITEWMGHRPALPDTIPVISPSYKTAGLYFSTGHGHLGLTYAATNARLVADMVTGRTSPIDIHPFRVNRF
jgi:D-amino-acid dehydrogenase